MTKRICSIKDVAKHRAACAERARRYRQKDRARWAEIARRHRWKIKGDVINHYGAKCACCGEATLQFLAIDHIDGGGNADRKRRFNGKVRGGTDFYRKLKQDGYPDGYRVLCHNCNQAIGFYGVCPHAS